MKPSPLTNEEVENRLDEALDPVLSSRRTAAPLAQALSEFTRTQQDFALRWVEGMGIGRINALFRRKEQY